MTAISITKKVFRTTYDNASTLIPLTLIVLLVTHGMAFAVYSYTGISTNLMDEIAEEGLTRPEMGPINIFIICLAKALSEAAFAIVFPIAITRKKFRMEEVRMSGHLAKTLGLKLICAGLLKDLITQTISLLPHNALTLLLLVSLEVLLSLSNFFIIFQRQSIISATVNSAMAILRNLKKFVTASTLLSMSFIIVATIGTAISVLVLPIVYITMFMLLAATKFIFYLEFEEKHRKHK